MRIEEQPKFTFDDVLIQPAHSDIINREAEIDVTINFFGKRILPIISSNMDYVTGAVMARAMQDAGGIGFLNRWEPIYNQRDDLELFPVNPLYISVGIRDLDESMGRIVIMKPQGVVIDVAHGDHERVIELIKRIKARFPNIIVVAGNIATQTGYWELARAGADAIKVGIGPGSVCTTREVTGVGVPQLSAIISATVEKKYWPNTLLIADGGINSSGDIVKALAAGADLVMLGRLLAGHEECPGDEVVQADGKSYKEYRGQSMLGTNGSRYAPEGVSGFVDSKGPVEATIRKLVGGMRSGFSYVGARNIEELRENTVFQVVSGGTKYESATRILQEV